MQNTLILGFAGLALVTASLAQAKDIAYQAGIKIWHNNLATSYRDSTGEVNGDYGAANSSVLSFSAKQNKFFIAGSTLLKSDYSLTPEAKTGNIDVPYMGVSSRKDFDLGVGWSFVPQLSVILGYKQVGGTRNYWFKKEMALANNSLINRPYGDYYVHNDLTVKAPFVGISGAQKISATTFIYANAIKGFGAKLDLAVHEGFKQINDTPPPAGVNPTQYVAKSQNFSPSADYHNIEIGLGYVVSKDMQLVLGYRSQKMTMDQREAELVEETGTMKGLNVGASYRF